MLATRNRGWLQEIVREAGQRVEQWPEWKRNQEPCTTSSQVQSAEPHQTNSTGVQETNQVPLRSR
jgi:hypothetical protein